jgi:hypothetical protein
MCVRDEGGGQIWMEVHMRNSIVKAGTLVLGLVLISGCTTYYKVADPSTGKTYYSTEVTQRGSGATTLKDARTGDEVTVQNSEVQKIKKEAYEAGKYAPAPAAESKPKT